MQFIWSWPDILFLSRWYKLYMVYLKLTRYFIFIQMIYTVHGLFQVDHIFYFSSRWYALYTFCLKFACLFSPLRWCTPIGRHVRDAKASRGHQVKVWYIKGQPISWLDSEQSHSPEWPPHWSKDVDSSDWDRFNIEDTFLCPLYQKLTQCYSYGYCIVYIVKELGTVSL